MALEKSIYRQGNKVYDSREIAMALSASPLGNTGGYSYLYVVKERNNSEDRRKYNGTNRK